jgi:ABC-type polysaccharide/polyol phosphate transport system ATPase subunit
VSEVALECVNVTKKFRKGEGFDSLRDFIPGIIGRSSQKEADDELNKDEFWALNDLSFQVIRGEALGIIGNNGAGKSTLLKLLSGIMKPTSGSITVSGKLSALIEVGAGFHDDLTGRENVYLNGLILGMSRAEIRRKFDEIVAFSGLAEFIDTPVKRYSTGMYARLGFSVAAHVDPEILLVDEVLSVGDWAFQSKSAQKLGDLIRGGATVVFVSHNLKAVGSLCSRCTLLENGRAVRTGLSEEVIRYYLQSNAERFSEPRDSKIRIVKVGVTRSGKDEARIRTGEKVLVTVTLRGQARCSELAVHVYINDGNFYKIFHTSTEFLGAGDISIGEDDDLKVSFELTMHLGMGVYYLGVVARSKFHMAGEEYDRRFPAASFYVDAPGNVNGPANLYPSLVDVTHRARSREVDCGLDVGE